MTATREREYEVADAQALVTEARALTERLCVAPFGSRAAMVYNHALERWRRRSAALEEITRQHEDDDEDPVCDDCMGTGIGYTPDSACPQCGGGGGLSKEQRRRDRADYLADRDDD